jgi:DNA-binding CsgD family transcriptional regulator
VELIGRAAEITRLHELLGQAAAGSGVALVVRGEPGIGKTALLAETAAYARASGLRVLHAVGVESEGHLPYAGLNQLLRPLRDSFKALPPSQREALRAGLGLSDAAAPEVYLVALAVLNLLAEVGAEDAPVLLVAEDAHWLDLPTADVLAFLGRRLESEPIVLLASVRNDSPARLGEAGLPELVIPPLSRPDAAALLDAAAPHLPAAVRGRLLAEAAGNPLALIELPAALGSEDGTAILASPWLPLTARLERAFTRRFADLPPATAAILEAAALNDSANVTEALDAARALNNLPVTAADLAPAARACLISPSSTELTFHHPLVRSAIHQSLDSERRRAVHHALAAALHDQPDRRTWHLASAASRPDEEIASALEAVAAQARQRGSGVTVVAALEQAAQLSPDPGRRADRLLRAADGAVEIGRPEIVERLLGQAAQLDLADQRPARLAWIRAAFDDGLRDQATDAAVLADLAEGVAADGDIDLAVRILWSAALRCFWTEPGPAARERIVDVAERLPLDPLDARVLAIVGYAAPLTRGTVVIERSARLLARPLLNPQSVRLVGSVAVLVGTFDVAIAQSAASVAGLRDQGRLQLLTRALAAQSWAAAQLAELTVAMPAAEEAARLASETGQPYLLGLALAIQAKIAALRGGFAQAEELAAEAERLGTPVGARPLLATAQHARALVALGQGDYEQALARLLRLHDVTDPCFQLALMCHTVADLADAASHADHPDDAAATLESLEASAKSTTSPALHDGLRLARAVLAAPDEAEAHFRSALAADLTRRPFTRARTEMAYGEWLRRQRRVTESRPHLRAARDTFDALGTAPWGERARHELRLAGERSGERQAVTHDILTAQELQIAQLAASGLTNREIGQRLYVSHRTVGAHLAKTYAKLAVTSRVQLRDALGPGSGQI